MHTPADAPIWKYWWGQRKSDGKLSDVTEGSPSKKPETYRSQPSRDHWVERPEHWREPSQPILKSRNLQLNKMWYKSLKTFYFIDLELTDHRRTGWSLWLPMAGCSHEIVGVLPLILYFFARVPPKAENKFDWGWLALWTRKCVCRPCLQWLQLCWSELNVFTVIQVIIFLCLTATVSKSFLEPKSCDMRKAWNKDGAGSSDYSR